MTTVVDYCSSCDNKKVIVNLTHYMCETCNRERRNERKKRDMFPIGHKKKMNHVQQGESLQKLKAELDEKNSTLVRISASDPVTEICNCYTCDNSGSWRVMQNGHFITRGKLSTRYEKINTHPQCEDCNVRKRGNLKVYEQNLIRDYGKQAVDELKQLSKVSVKFDRDWYRDKLTEVNLALMSIDTQLT